MSGGNGTAARPLTRQQKAAVIIGVLGAESAALDGTSRRQVQNRGVTHENLRPGLAFMAIHTPDEADINVLTLDAWDPKSGTAEFKATAVSIESVRGPAVALADSSVVRGLQ